jgi:nitrate/nitrite transporter NarK
MLNVEGGRHEFSLWIRPRWNATAKPSPPRKIALPQDSGILWTDHFKQRAICSNMETFATASLSAPMPAVSNGGTRHILSFTYFTLVCYFSIGLPLAVLPPYVHYRMGYSAALAGLVISIQYIATLLSRPWAGRISDRAGAKVSVMWGMGACTASGALLVAAAASLHLAPLHSRTVFSLSLLIASRLVLGVGESLGSTGSTL